MINKIFKPKKLPFHLNGKASNAAGIKSVEKTKQPIAFKILTHKREIYKYVLGCSLVTTLLLCIVIVIQFIGFKSALADKESQMFVVKDGKVYEAQKDESFARSDIEIDLFVRTWLSNAFSYDKHTYEDRINMALEWMDAQGADAFFRGSEKSNTQNRLNNSNANTGISIDSLMVTKTSKLTKAVAYFNWKTFVNGDLNTTASYKLTTDIKPVRRTSKHPYAMILTNTKYHLVKK